MGVTKRLRFEILRRDGYSCRYCGSGENLTVDHVVPTALGGSDEPENLTTACRDCNYGKTSTPPDAPLVADVAQDALRWSRAMKQAADSLSADRDAERHVIAELLDLWLEVMPQFARPPVDAEYTLQVILRTGLPCTEMDYAIRKAAGANHVPQHQRFKYFCGICWNLVAEMHKRAQAILEADE